MADANIEATMNVGADKLFAAICRYEDYPEFVTGVDSVRVERKAQGHARVTYKLNIVKEIQYTLDLTEEKIESAGKTHYRVHWKLHDSDFFKSNNGSWEFEESQPGKTQVKYAIAAEFKIPVPGFILKKIIAGNLPGVIESFEKRARALK